MSLLRLLPTAALLFCACDELETYGAPENSHPKTPASSATVLSAEALAKKEEQAKANARIKELKVEIEYSKSVISDLEAAVLMERAKVEDDPDYDQSFLQETLADQQHQRELIERAQKQIEKLEATAE